ncbi:ABC transporter substrate-binding protein [Roseomonas terrae]|jgi:peptide/nickel transport system substrate-binding protein|uniref:ABC transporter substrate-binding protein n=1 Tax=Neoroseomonas terrae TaxID=424799 RepID=A0ABS5ECB3_9PROT|nr:ABC transporter substrate-binding protein [Neoroseomonas terrae]MBR0648660.1 ABC transporter substrate-binding protein [Neoroseomonas terrae]
MMPLLRLVLMTALFAVPGVSSAQTAGGTAVIAVSGDPGHLNPAISTAGPLHAVAGSLFNGLVSLDEAGMPQPDLAESWTVAPDGLSVTFRLRPGVQWHDGRPFTSEDVKVSFEQVLLRFHARARAGLAPAIAGIETPDAATVVFRLHRPHPALLRQLDVTEAPIVPAHLFAGTDPNANPANLRPVGTGPFRFDSYRRDDQVVLTRNPHYFKPGLPRLDRVVFRIIPDANTQVNALAAGEVDMLARVSPPDVARLRGRGVTSMETRAAAGGANCIMTLAFNLDRPVPGNIALRQAFALGLDRQQVLDRVAFGQGRVADAPIASGIAWAHQTGALAAWNHDAAEANRRLDAAGLARGADGLRATLDIAHFPAFARWSEIMRQQLAPLGIALRVRTMDPAAFAQAVFTRRDFDLALISYCNGTDPEIGVRRMVHSSAVGNVPFSNAAGYRNAEVDALFDRAASLQDDAARGEAYRAAQAIVARDLPYWWLVETDFTAAWRDNLADFAPWTGQVAERAWRSR